MSENLFDLTGRNILITGSSRGLGLAMARGLAEAGARIILNGRDEKRLDKALDELAGEGLETCGSSFDVTEPDQITPAIKEIERKVGTIDVLINNAGIQQMRRLRELSLEDFQEVINTNLTSAFLVSKAVIGGMIERKKGKIINICSLMSEVGRETIGAYSAAKGGLKMLTKAMCVEWARFNIQTNGIGPGYFQTDMTRNLAKDRKFDFWLKSRTPAGRWGEPAELIGPAVFLASDASNFVNGQIIYVDGGLLAGI